MRDRDRELTGSTLNSISLCDEHYSSSVYRGAAVEVEAGEAGDGAAGGGSRSAAAAEIFPLSLQRRDRNIAISNKLFSRDESFFSNSLLLIVLHPRYYSLLIITALINTGGFRSLVPECFLL